MPSFAPASFGYLLVTLFVACLPFEDSILQNTPIGFFGSSLSLIPLCLLLLLYPAWAKTRAFLGIMALTVLCSLLGLLLNTELAGNALARGSRFFIIWTTFFACLFWFKKKYLAFTPFHAYLLLTILTVSILMEMFMHEFLLSTSIFHANPSGNMRPRGFTGESSQFGYQIVLGFLFCGMLLKRGIGFLAIAAAAAFFSGSKGALLSLVISIFFARVWLSDGKLTKLAVAAVLLPTMLFVFNTFLLDRFQADLDDYTSLSTRLTLSVLAVQSFLANPLGYGMTGFATMFPTNGPAALDFMQGYGFSGLALREVVEIFDPNETKNIGLKSLFLEMGTIYGVAGIYLIVRNSRAAVRYFTSSNNIVGLTLVFFLLLSNLFFVSPVAAYLTPMVVGVVLGYIRRDGTAEGSAT
jgi:hypothetical protein